MLFTGTFDSTQQFFGQQPVYTGRVSVCKSEHARIPVAVSIQFTGMCHTNQILVLQFTPKQSKRGEKYFNSQHSITFTVTEQTQKQLIGVYKCKKTMDRGVVRLFIK